MFCPHCGSFNHAATSQCTVCGTGLPSAAADVPTGIDIGAAATHVPTAAADMTRAIEPHDLPRGAAAAFAPGRNVAGRYHIIRLLGAGGMGAVYQAFDEKLSVPVALKVILQPHAGGHAQTAEAMERRFKRELLLARQVTDKNVVRIHDLGEVDGTLYITMPYVEGDNLSVLLARDGTLPIDRVLQIAKQVASGLAAAHDAGVVHRDLKPANIMIAADDGRALIMDFGIARSASASAAATGTGAIVGTLGYMAPEQAEGKMVDHRCDLYAFGLILYDLLTGGRRADGSVVADLMARMQKPVPSVRTSAPDVPEALARIIDRCLERDPDARFATTAELVQALNRLDARGHELRPAAPRRNKGLLVANAVAFVLVAAVVAWNLRGRGGSPTPTPVHETVSVLIADFENHASDPVFDGSIEQALTIGVEGAPFITTCQRTQARNLAAQLIAGGPRCEPDLVTPAGQRS